MVKPTQGFDVFFVVLEPAAVRVMFEEFIATGAHYDETLRAQFPLFRGDPPPGHPYPEA